MIKHVQIFGERCSGTNYLKSLIEKNFTGVQITKAYGGKHWFIKGHHPRGRTNRSTDYECIRSLSDSDDTLFTIIYRNPFDWLRSLHTSPYHAGNHSDLTFSQFIRKPWISFETTRMNPAWPKRDDDYYFIEEAQNILQLRTLKIRHLNTLEHVVSNVSFVNYEGLTSNNELLGEHSGSLRNSARGPTAGWRDILFRGRADQGLRSSEAVPPNIRGGPRLHSGES